MDMIEVIVVFPVPWPPANPIIKDDFFLTFLLIQKHNGIK